MNQLNRYQIIGQIGSGAMAVVYRAYDPQFKREVAIKVMSSRTLHDSQFRQRFEREAQVMAGLQHPAIVPVYDFGEENGQPYLVMALISGGSLADRFLEGAFLPAQALFLIESLAPALDLAHQKGVIHRDVKPTNILFDQQGNPYLMDFGLARLLNTTTIAPSKTVVGTPFYISPEQARGEKMIDGRSDIYALGIILFESLTGQRPYDADTPVAVIYKQIHEPVPNILTINPDLPSGCEVVIAKAMAKNRSERYVTASEMAAALRVVVEERGSTAQTTALTLKWNDFSPYSDKNEALHTSPKKSSSSLSWDDFSPLPSSKKKVMPVMPTPSAEEAEKNISPRNEGAASSFSLPETSHAAERGIDLISALTSQAKNSLKATYQRKGGVPTGVLHFFKKQEHPRQRNLYAFDCGTTNWRLQWLMCEETEEKDGTRQLRALCEPQRVALTTFTGHHLPATLLLNEHDQVHSYGVNSDDLSDDIDLRPYLREAFKPCIGHCGPVDRLTPNQRYTHEEALTYTQLLLQEVLTRLQKEKPRRFNEHSLFYFAHPVHWGIEEKNGVIKGEILRDFATIVRSCFPEKMQNNVHFVPEPQGALASLSQSKQLAVDNKWTLVVDVGGGTSDFVAGRLKEQKLEEVRHYGEPIGGRTFDHDLALHLVDLLKVPAEKWEEGLLGLRGDGRNLKEELSRQVHKNDNIPVGKSVSVILFDEQDEPMLLYQRVQFQKTDFEKLTERTIASFKGLVWQALVKMELHKSDIGQVVLVGGGANLYLIPQLLRAIFGNTIPISYADPPEETVVRGTALWPCSN